jgi:abequosyltransferase
MTPLPTLSICIPTFNRAALLRECLESIVRSAADCAGQVEIVISDNASPDDTSAVVADFQRTYPFIRYQRQAENIGGENNFYAVAQMAQGEYIWLLGDDDKLLPPAVPTALRQLQPGYDFLISNYSVWSQDFSTIKLQRMMPLRQDRVFDDPNSLLTGLGMHLAYISAIVLRKTLFLAPPRSEYDRFAPYGLAFLYLIYAALAPHCHGLYVATPLFGNRQNPTAEAGQLWDKTFITGTQAVLARLRELGYSEKAVYAAQDRLLRDFVLRTLLGRVRDGQSPWPMLRLMFPDFKRHWYFWAVCIPAALIPPAALKLATRVVRRYRKSG